VLLLIFYYIVLQALIEIIFGAASALLLYPSRFAQMLLSL